MKYSRREVLKIAWFSVLEYQVIPSLFINNPKKEVPIIIGISSSGLAVMNLCFLFGINASYYLIEQRQDKFSASFDLKRAYVNPGENGIFNFKGLIIPWLKITKQNVNKCTRPIIITGEIGDHYSTLASRVVFDDLHETNANVFWVLVLPLKHEEQSKIRIASRYAHEIAHLPNVIICNNENSRFKQKNIWLSKNSTQSIEYLFNHVKSIIEEY